MNKKILVIMLIICMIGISSAQTYQFEKPIYHTHDGRWINSDELEMGTDNYPYLIDDMGDNWKYTIDGKSVFIPKTFNIKEYPTKISPTLTYSKTALINNMINYNDTVAYLVFPYSLSQTKTWSDNNNIQLGRWIFKAGSEHISIYDEYGNYLSPEYYDFKIVNDEIRLYFVKSEANNLNGNIIFEMHSWNIEDVIQYVEDTYTISPSINASLYDININITYPLFESTTDGLILHLKLDDNYIDSSISGDNGISHGSNISFVNGKINNGTIFNGIDDYIDISNTSFVANSSICFWFIPISTVYKNRLITSDSSNSYPFTIATSSNNAIAFTDISNLNGISAPPISDDTLTHIIINMGGDNNNTSIYYNSINQSIIHENIELTEASVISTIVGKDGTFSFPEVIIDDFRYYNHILNESERDSIYYNTPIQLQVNTTNNTNYTTWDSITDNPLTIITDDLEIVSGLEFSMSDTIIINGDTIYDALSTTIFNVTHYTVSKMLPVSNLTATPYIDYALIEWDDILLADYYNVYRIEPSILFTNETIVLDGNLDNEYEDIGQRGLLKSPNPEYLNQYDTIYTILNETTIFMFASAHDNDTSSIDDSIEIYFDFETDGLTTDDKAYIIKENEQIIKQKWSGSQWISDGVTDADGIVLGSGTNNTDYELFIPLSELPELTYGEDINLTVRHKNTFSADTESYFPNTAYSVENTTGWQNLFVENTSAAADVFLFNTTNPYFSLTELHDISWYRVGVSAVYSIKGSDITYIDFITNHYPEYFIEGYVYDSNTLIEINNALVTVTDTFTSGFVYTNISGYYKFNGLRNDTYTIEASAAGYDNNDIEVIISGNNATVQTILLNYIGRSVDDVYNLLVETNNNLESKILNLETKMNNLKMFILMSAMIVIGALYENKRRK